MAKTKVKESALFIPRLGEGTIKIEVQKARVLLALSDATKPVPAAHSGTGTGTSRNSRGEYADAQMVGREAYLGGNIRGQ